MTNVSVYIYGLLSFVLFMSQSQTDSVIFQTENGKTYYYERTYRCPNGRYIGSIGFCPGEDSWGYYPGDSCLERGSKLIGCDREKCQGDFKCNNGSCVKVKARCDTKKDCEDGSDELNCGDEVNVGNCSLADEKFLCHDRLRCLDLERTCDRECNCFDCSDEIEDCEVRGDNKVIKKCPHQYFATPNGPKCFCDSNDPKMNKLCQNVKPCTDNITHMCSQKCSLYKNRITCSCYENYITKFKKNAIQCINKAYYNNLLIYSTSNQMKLFNLTSGQSTVVMKNTLIAAVAGAHNHIYYTTYDDDRKTINRVSIATKEATRLFKSNSSIVSMAFDYIANNLYLTTNTSLLACSAEKERCLELKCCNVGYVALAPKSGLMFYMKKATFQDQHYIMKSEMDGSNEEYLVDGGFNHFSHLAVDESTRKLYWVQSEENEIWCLSFDDASNNEMLRSMKYDYTLFHFTVLDSQLMFTKSHDNEIYKIDNFERFTKTKSKNDNRRPEWRTYHAISYVYRSGGEIREGMHFPKYENYENLYDQFKENTDTSLSDANATRLIDYNVTFAIKYIQAYNPSLQNATKNPCAEASCDGLCLVSNSNSAGYVCKDFEELKRSDDGGIGQDNMISTKVEYSYSARENGHSESSEHSQNKWKFLVICLAVLAVMAVVLIVYSRLGFSKLGTKFWFKNRSGLQNLRWNRENVNDQDNMMNHVDF